MSDNMSENNELIKKIAEGAQKHLSSDNPTELRLEEVVFMNIATDDWIEVASKQNPTYPTKREIKKYLEEVVHEVVKEIATKQRDVTSVTLAFATEQLINYLFAKAGWTVLNPYLIPLEILSAVVYAKALKVLATKL